MLFVGFVEVKAFGRIFA